MHDELSHSNADQKPVVHRYNKSKKKECTVVYQQKAFTTAIATIAEASRITMLKRKVADVLYAI